MAQVIEHLPILAGTRYQKKKKKKKLKNTRFRVQKGGMTPRTQPCCNILISQSLSIVVNEKAL
jgi:hypothetical protein